MQAFIRTASIGAALLAGTAAAHAQYVIAPDAEYVAPPAYVATPGVTYAPGPAYVVAAPTYAAPAYVAPGARVIVTQPPVAEEIVTQPAPRTIVTTQQPIMTQTQESVRETSVERTAPRIIHHSARTTRVHLTSRQRRDVLRTIRYERTATPIARERIVTRTATAPAVTYSVGSVLPATVPTYAMPRQVVYEAPALQGYAYAPVGNQVLVVEPASNTIVADLQ